MAGFRDSSALFAVFGHADAARLALAGLEAQAHRGGAGTTIVVSDGDGLRATSGERLIEARAGGRMLGHSALGQVYGRTASAEDPLVVGRYRGGAIAVAICGRLTNGTRLRRELRDRGALFRTSGEAEVLAHLLAQSTQGTLVNRLVDALWRVEGAFSAAILTPERLVVVRDPRGFRPLVLGRLGEAWVASTEDAPIWLAGGTGAREVEPGEMVIIDAKGFQHVQPFLPRPRRQCGQEHVGLARADARVFGRDVHAQRRALGERLAIEHPPPPHAVVVALGGSAEDSALAYARIGKCLFEAALKPAPVRHGGTGTRWRVVGSAIEGQVVVIVASSLVTGTAVIGAAQALRAAGAARLVLCVAAPRVRHACVYGVSSPTADELVAPRANDDEGLARLLGVDQLATLSLEGLVSVLGRRADGPTEHCLACWTGEHPVTPEEPDDQLPLF